MRPMESFGPHVCDGAAPLARRQRASGRPGPCYKTATPEREGELDMPSGRPNAEPAPTRTSRLSRRLSELSRRPAAWIGLFFVTLTGAGGAWGAHDYAIGTPSGWLEPADAQAFGALPLGQRWDTGLALRRARERLEALDPHLTEQVPLSAVAACLLRDPTRAGKVERWLRAPEHTAARLSPLLRDVGSVCRGETLSVGDWTLTPADDRFEGAELVLPEATLVLREGGTPVIATVHLDGGPPRFENPALLMPEGSELGIFESARMEAPVRRLPLESFAPDQPKLVTSKTYTYRWAVPIEDASMRKVLGGKESVDLLHASARLSFYPRGVVQTPPLPTLPPSWRALRGSEGAEGFVLEGSVELLSMPVASGQLHWFPGAYFLADMGELTVPLGPTGIRLQKALAYYDLRDQRLVASGALKASMGLDVFPVPVDAGWVQSMAIQQANGLVRERIGATLPSAHLSATVDLDLGAKGMRLWAEHDGAELFQASLTDCRLSFGGALAVPVCL
jgi:hypothetical protein